MKFIKSTITALGLLFTVTACAGNKESKNQNMKGENMEIVHLTKRIQTGKQASGSETSGRDQRVERPDASVGRTDGKDG